MSPPMHRILDANDGIAKHASIAIENTLRKETCIQVKCIEIGKKEMLAAVKRIDLYVTFHSYALLDSKPVLGVFVKCAY